MSARPPALTWTQDVFNAAHLVYRIPLVDVTSRVKLSTLVQYDSPLCQRH